QMRAIIRERLAAGESPDEVQRYFVQRYGEWILLSPPRRGFNLPVWLLPLVFVIAGFAVVAILVRQWPRRPRGAAEPVAVDPAMSERIRREVERGSCPAPRAPRGGSGRPPRSSRSGPFFPR